MTAVPGTTTTSANPNTSTNTTLTVAGLSTDPNVLNVVEISGHAVGTAINPSMGTPSGWTKLGENMQATGTPATWVGVYVRFGGTASQVFTWTNAGQMVAEATQWTGTDTTTPVPWIIFLNKAASNTTYSITGSPTAAGTLNYGFACRTSPGTWSGGSLATDVTKGTFANSSAAAIVTAYQAAQVASGASQTKTATGPSTSIGQQWMYVIKDSAAPVSSAAITWLNTRKHLGKVKGSQYVSHRDGTWGVYGEETLEGYLEAAAYNSFAALEISVWDTLDGVWVCSHDNSTGTAGHVVFDGTAVNITASTWASISGKKTLVGGFNIRRIEDILDAFPDRIFVVENKHGTSQAALVSILNAHASGRWIGKHYYSDTANANTNLSNSSPVWMYFYPADLTNLSSTYSALVGGSVPIVFGLGDFSTAPVPTQTDTNTFFSFTSLNGIMTWAHILGTSAQKTTAESQATTSGHDFDGYMMKDIKAVIATDRTSTIPRSRKNGLPVVKVSRNTRVSGTPTSATRKVRVNGAAT